MATVTVTPHPVSFPEDYAVEIRPQILLTVAIGSDNPRYDYFFLSNYATLHEYDALALGGRF